MLWFILAIAASTTTHTVPLHDRNLTSADAVYVAMEPPSTLLIVSAAGKFVSNGTSAYCTIRSLDSTFVRLDYNATGSYNPMKRMPLTVLNATHATCNTVPLHNGAPATLKITLNNGSTYLASEGALFFAPLVEVAVGRRPYTSEAAGTLVVKVGDARVMGGADISVSLAASLVLDGEPVSKVHSLLVCGGAALGETKLLPLSFAGLPATSIGTLTVRVEIDRATGGAPVVYFIRKRFHRVAPPGADHGNGTVVVVDHVTRGFLVGRGGETPWLPFLGVGWFNSPFAYAAEGGGDPSYVPPSSEVDSHLVLGSRRVVEWGRKGANLIRVGWKLPVEKMLAMLDSIHTAGLSAIVSVPASTWATCNTSRPQPGRPLPPTCSEAWESLTSNISAVRSHPALFSYYICDDCCKGWEYLKQLSAVYEAMKLLDPYHPTSGALECGEMHAFQEPFLSLDLPMRENYVPFLIGHDGDGLFDQPGSDGSLRMPPMTFEPMMNMADAVRQPIAKLARAAAWLGVITADMPMQNWYVFNEIMYQRWQLEDETSAVDAAILSLQSSLQGDVRTVHPTLRVVTGGALVRAKAWRDGAYEERENATCVHLVVVSVAALAPTQFTLHLDDIDILPTSSPSRAAAHLFYESYSVSLSPAIGGAKTSSTLALSDVLTPGSSAVYAIGCGVSAPLHVDPLNLVSDPGFEYSEQPLVPGFISCATESLYPPGTFNGACKSEDKHAGSWGLAQIDDHRDGRAAMHVDPRLPRSGRLAGRVWIPSADVPVQMVLPSFTGRIVNGSSAFSGAHGVQALNDTAYVVSFFARSFPPGISCELVLGRWRVGVAGSGPVAVESSASNNVNFPVGGPLSSTKYDLFESATSLHPPLRLSGEWQEIKVEVPLDSARPDSAVFAFVIGGDVGSVWLDDVAVHVAA